jgi:lipoteichoic acid synthase
MRTCASADPCGLVGGRPLPGVVVPDAGGRAMTQRAGAKMTARAPVVPVTVLLCAGLYLVLAAPLLVRLNALRLTVLPDGAGSYLRLIAWELPVLVCLIALVEWRGRLASVPGRVLVVLGAAALWTVLLADALVFRIFGLRLTFPDVVRYGTRASDILAFLDARLLGAVVGAAGLAALGLLVAQVRRGRTGAVDTGRGAGRRRWPRRVSARVALPVLALVALLTASGLTPPDDGDLYGWVYQNWVSLNTRNSLFAPYSPAFADSVRAAADADAGCGPLEAEDGTPPDVVLVLLESFSSGYSAAYGGREPRLPELDRITGGGLRFTRFLANGFTTEHGLIGILGTALPVFSAGVDVRSLTGNMAFAGFYGLPHSVPACAAALGYHTEFLTSGDLSFTAKGNWLLSVGFHRVEGHDAPPYAGLPRGMFKAVRDSVLYHRVLHRIGELNADPRPFLLVVEGVDSHGPYRGTGGLPAALAAADADLGHFHDRLRETGFLDRGLLVLVSDHRAQVALSPHERERFGPEAAARVPAAILGRGIPPGEDTLPRHQLDLRPTLVHLATGRAPAPALAASMLRDPPARCIPWLNAGRRDEVVARCPHGVVRIRLDGDNTRVVHGEPSTEADALIAAIHRVRIAASVPERQAP